MLCAALKPSAPSLRVTRAEGGTGTGGKVGFGVVCSNESTRPKTPLFLALEGNLLTGAAEYFPPTVP